jgi:hypothetical protein
MTAGSDAMRFSATEAGYKDGLGGASNARSKGKHHYVLFGLQKDETHPSNSGIYFKYDDEINGSVNAVRSIVLSENMAKFLLIDSTEIVVMNNVSGTEWKDFAQGIEVVFGTDRIT